MSVYSATILFAVVLATNLVLAGAVIICGTNLAFKLIENVSPRLRYGIAVAVFLSAVLIPVYFTVKTPSPKISPLNMFVEITNDSGAQNLLQQSRILTGQSGGGHSTGEFFNDFIMSIVDSWFGSVFLLCWISGSFALFLREAAGFHRLRRIRKLWQPATDFERKTLRCPQGVPIYFDEDQSPGTAGLLRPVIVLPKHFLSELPLDTIRAVVQHELAHVRRRDPLISLSLRLLRALFWINPALWLLERLVNTEREAAADRSAIDFMADEAKSGTPRLGYAEALLAAAKNLNSFESRSRKSPAVGFGTGSELEIRICRILSTTPTTRRHIAAAGSALGLTFMALAFIPAAAFPDKLQSLIKDTSASVSPAKNNSTLNEPGRSSREDTNLPDYSATAGTKRTGKDYQAAFQTGVSNRGENKGLLAMETSQPFEAPQNFSETKKEVDNPDRLEAIDNSDGLTVPFSTQDAASTTSSQELLPARAPQELDSEVILSQAREKSMPGQSNRIAEKAGQLSPATSLMSKKPASLYFPEPARASEQ